MPIDRKTVEQVARLARLELTPEEIDRYGAQLGSILDYMEELKKLDVSGVQPLAHAGDFKNVFRDDAPRESLPKDDILRNAPERAGDFFVVPKIIE